MHVKLLKELLDLDKYKTNTRQTLHNQLNPSESKSQSYKLKEKVNYDDRRQDQNIKKMKTKDNKHNKDVKADDDNDISSNLMNTIIDAHEPVDLDLQSDGNFDVLSNTSSYDSFYDTN